MLVAASLIEGLRKLMLPSRYDSPEVACKLSHSLSSPSTFHVDIDAYMLADEPTKRQDTVPVTSPLSETISPNATLKPSMLLFVSRYYIIFISP